MSKIINTSDRPQPLTDLLSVPLAAVTSANGEMAKTQLDFLLTTGFTKNAGVYESNNIELTLTEGNIPLGNATGETQPLSQTETGFSIPLLSMVSFNNNNLVMNNIDISLDLEITHLEKDNEQRVQWFAKTMGEENPAGIVMNITMKVNSAPLPVGIHQLIEEFTEKTTD